MDMDEEDEVVVLVVNARFKVFERCENIEVDAS